MLSQPFNLLNVSTEAVSASPYNNIKCPLCGGKDFTTGPMTQTLKFIQPRIIDGVTVTKDTNNVTVECQCNICSSHFSINKLAYEEHFKNI